MTHTPTPWEEKYPGHLCGSNGRPTANFMGYSDGQRASRYENLDNCARTKACMNAFPDDIPTEQIAALKPGAVRALVDGRVTSVMNEARPLLAYLASDCEPDPELDSEFGPRMAAMYERFRALLKEIEG